MLKTKLHLELRLRISGAIPLFPHMPSWNVQEQLYIFKVNYYIGAILETLSKFFSPTDAEGNCFTRSIKIYIKIYIKTAVLM